MHSISKTIAACFVLLASGMALAETADVKVEATMMDGNFTYRAAEKTYRQRREWSVAPRSFMLASREFTRYFYCGHTTSQAHDHVPSSH